MRKILYLVIALATVIVACKKEDNKVEPQTPPGNNNNNNNNNNNDNLPIANNSFIVHKPDGTSEPIPFTLVEVNESEAYAFVARFNVGAQSQYDRVAISFKTRPEDGTYPLVFPQDGKPKNLNPGEAHHNTIYDGKNYVTKDGSHQVVVTTEINGKKKLSFQNLPMLYWGTVVNGGTQLPEGSTISGVIIEN